MTTSRRGKSALGVDHALTINDGRGMEMGQGLTLDSRLIYQIVRDEGRVAQPFRITTVMYMHTIKQTNGSAELVSAHWHPTGASPYRSPHWHLGSAALADTGVFTPRAHLPAPRTALEDVVRLAIDQFNLSPQREDWDEVLRECEATFVRHRSWG